MRAVVTRTALALAIGALAFGAASSWAAAGSRTQLSVPARVRARLLAIVEEEASRNGDQAPYDIEAVRTTVGQAAAAKGEPFTGPTPEPVHAVIYLLAARGHFDCGGCSGPPGSGPFRGSVLILELDRHTLRVNLFGLGDRYPRMAIAGEPTRLG